LGRPKCALALALWGADESSREAIEKLVKLNREQGDNIYGRIGLAERGRMGRIN